MTTKATLAFYVADFKNWRQENYTAEQVAANTTDDPAYPKWKELESFYIQLLRTKQITQLDEDDRANLVYLIARDWDTVIFLSWLSDKRPLTFRGELPDEDFIKLAKASLTLNGAEYNAGKSSIAACFRKFEYITPEIESILLQLYADKDEYTKRQAIFSLAKLGYKAITDLVKISWTIDDEWHKMGCLHVLDEYVADRTLLNEYLTEAADDNREYLSGYAQEIKAKNNM